MLYKTRGIVLHNLKYNDKYAITQIYTEEFGRVAYLTSKEKSKNSKVPKSLFHALSVIDLEVEHKNLRDIQRIKEARIHLPLSEILSNPVKSTISIFLAEFISNTTKDIQSNKILFDFILHSIRILDLSESGTANFHLVFMIRLSIFLGFYPNADGYIPGMFFDMQNGVFVRTKPLHPHFLNPDESRIFFLLLRMNYENMHTFSFSGNNRADIILRILEYYKLHLSELPEIKSLEIFHSFFHSV